jgi:hypothetical protein
MTNLERLNPGKIPLGAPLRGIFPGTDESRLNEGSYETSPIT